MKFIISLKVFNDRRFLDLYFTVRTDTLSNAPKSQDGFSASLWKICLLMYLVSLSIRYFKQTHMRKTGKKS